MTFPNSRETKETSQRHSRGYRLLTAFLIEARGSDNAWNFRNRRSTGGNDKG
jgi:hypothetical protein